MNEGWIKLYRKFTDWEWFNISEMVHLFIYLLLNANHEDGVWRGVIVKRGQIITGLHALNERTKISIRTLRTCLSRLEKTQEIDIQTTNKYSIITILKYDDYQVQRQASDNQPDKQTTNKRQTNDNKQEYKEEKELKNVIPPTIEMVKKYCQERVSVIDPQYFVDWNDARGWMLNGKKMKDWQATIRTWEKRQKEYGSNKQNYSGKLKDVNSQWQ